MCRDTTTRVTHTVGWGLLRNKKYGGGVPEPRECQVPGTSTAAILQYLD